MSIVKRLTSMYYSVGGAIGLSSDVIDAANEAGATARFDTNAVVITYPDGRESFHTVPLGTRAKAAKFVNRFNEKSAECAGG